MKSQSTRALFAAARAEGPSRASRAAMWQNVEAGLALVPPAAASGTRLADAIRPDSAPAAPPATVSVIKAGVIGGGIGSGVTAIAVFAALHASPPVLDAAVDAPSESRAVVAVDGREARAPSVLAPITAAPAEPSRARTEQEPAAAAPSAEDALAREFSLVMGARAALVAGDPLRALDLASRARAANGQLGHEARTLELRALRALGRDQEADRVEIELRVRSVGTR